MDTITQDTEISYIYALCDPDTEEVRYIGFSNRPQVRYRNHIVGAKYTKKKRTKKEEWIYSLVQQGKSPKLKILEPYPTTVKIQGANMLAIYGAEREWIMHYLSLGANLVNDLRSFSQT